MVDLSSKPALEQMLALSDEDFAKIDPLIMNLVVAQGIPSLANLDIEHYTHKLTTGQTRFETTFLPLTPDSISGRTAGGTTWISPDWR